MQVLNMIVVRAQNAWFAAREEESGQTLVEYALIIALVAVTAIVALKLLSTQINDLFGRASNELSKA